MGNPAGRPQTRVVVDSKGPSYAFSPWEAPDRARQSNVGALHLPPCGGIRGVVTWGHWICCQMGA